MFYMTNVKAYCSNIIYYDDFDQPLDCCRIGIVVRLFLVMTSSGGYCQVQMVLCISVKFNDILVAWLLNFVTKQVIGHAIFSRVHCVEVC